jgi:hypothetical protein
LLVQCLSLMVAVPVFLHRAITSLGGHDLDRWAVEWV